MAKYERLNLHQLLAGKKEEAGGKLKFDPAKIERIKSYTGVILGILGVAGILAVTVLAPNALQALDLFERRRKRPASSPAKRRAKLLKTFYYLKESGQIEFRRAEGDNYEVVLTDKGKKELRRFDIETLYVPKAEKWDQKFWQVAADIPTKNYRRGADALRRKLREMEFYPLQRTLWFYPYDPRAELEFICQIYGISRFVTAMKIAELDPSDERVLRDFFRKRDVI